MEGLHPARLARLDTMADSSFDAEHVESGHARAEDSYQKKTGANMQPLGPRGSGVTKEVSYGNNPSYDKPTAPAHALERVVQHHDLEEIYEKSIEGIVAQEDAEATRLAFAESLDELIAEVRDELDPGNKRLPNLPYQPGGEKGVGIRTLTQQELPIRGRFATVRGNSARRNIITSVPPSTLRQGGLNKRKYEPSQEKIPADDIYSMTPTDLNRGGFSRKYTEAPRAKAARTETGRLDDLDSTRPYPGLGGLGYETIPSRTKKVFSDLRGLKSPAPSSSRSRDDFTRPSCVLPEDRTGKTTADTIGHRRQPTLSRSPRAQETEPARIGLPRSHRSHPLLEKEILGSRRLETPFEGSIFLQTKLADVEEDMVKPWEPERAIMWVGGRHSPERGSVVTVVQKASPYRWNAHVFCLSEHQSPTSNDVELWAIIKAIEMAYETNEARTRRVVVYTHCQGGLTMLENNVSTRESGLIETVASRSRLLYEQGMKLELHWTSKKYDTGPHLSAAAANTAVAKSLPISTRREHEKHSRPIIFTGSSPTNLVEATRKWQPRRYPHYYVKVTQDLCTVRCQCFQKNYPHRDRAGRDGRESIGLVIALRRVKLLYRVNNQGYGRPKGIFVTIITTEFEKPFADGHSVKHD